MISRRLIASCLPIFLCLFVFSLACGCNGSASGNSPLNMVGSWTIHTVSTQGHGSFSGTATVAQSGVGLGKNGATTLTAPIGTIAVSQSGTALNGTLTDSIKGLQFSFIGTLSGGTITITGSTPCPSSTQTDSISITGTITSTNMQGTYTITRGSNCYYPSDGGSWVATKQ